MDIAFFFHDIVFVTYHPLWPIPRPCSHDLWYFSSYGFFPPLLPSCNLFWGYVLRKEHRGIVSHAISNVSQLLNDLFCNCV